MPESKYAAFHHALALSRGFQESLHALRDPILKLQMARILCERLIGFTEAIVAEGIEVISEESYIAGLDSPTLADPEDVLQFETTHANGLFERPGYMRKNGDTFLVWSLNLPQVLNVQEVDQYEISQLLGDAYDGALDSDRPLVAPLHFPVDKIIDIRVPQ